MPEYLYVCGRSHRTARVRAVKARNRPTRCPACGEPARRDPVAEIRSQSIYALPEIPSHFNRSFGCQVESRKHLEHLQKKHGKTDASGASIAAMSPPTDFR